MTNIVRSRSTGKYHSGNGPYSTQCNHSGQRRMPSLVKAQRGEVEKAGEHMFCKKCFLGKPTADRLDRIFCE
jgi:hypothetical protein